MTRVLKFGGAALRDGEGVRRASRLVRARGGPRPLLVVSAHHGVTDLLERVARHPDTWRAGWDELRVRHRSLLRQLELPSDLLDRHLSELRALLAAGAEASPDARRADYILSFGERMSARVVAAALRRDGHAAIPVDAFDLGLECEVREGRPFPTAEALTGLARGLARLQGIPVVTGFLARDAQGDLLTLGRDGTELSAAWLALATRAEEVQLWKEESGILTADPRHVPDARPVPELSWDEAEVVARFGPGVLHADCVEPLRRSGALLRVLDARHPSVPGTLVRGGPSPPGIRAWVHRGGLLRQVVEAGSSRPAGGLVRRRLAGGREEWLVRAVGPGAPAWAVVVPVGRQVDAGPGDSGNPTVRAGAVRAGIETWPSAEGLHPPLCVVREELLGQTLRYLHDALRLDPVGGPGLR